MNQIKNLFVLLLLFSLSASCNQGEKKTSESEEIAESILSVGDVLESPEKYKDSEIKISGMVTHVCKHGGQKLFIVGEDPEEQLRITIGEGLTEFDLALEGSTVEFSGKVLILEEEVKEALKSENEDKEHHTGEEPHAEAESASYYVEANAFKELTTEVE